MKNQEIAAKIQATADVLGWTYSVSGGVLTIMKNFTAGSREEFVIADGEYYDILSLLPMSSPGSIWGTDGGGIGAVSAMKIGKMVMNKSGGNKNVLRELEKLYGT